MRILALLFATSMSVAAQTPQVPRKMDFGGITLTIREDARREIQKDVDALWQSPKHLAIKVEKARTYFPIIEKIFEEERVPDDFKFLVLQESALIPDAVSVSNAVGYWQFKDFTAAEMGMRVDKHIDERMNIVSSTTAAARYIKKNNFYFNNWVYALQAYQMGAGGVMKAEKNYQSGTKQMDITSNTYWYVKKFLAHKVAFEGIVESPGATQLLLFENKTNKNIAELADDLSVDEGGLMEYNKWIRGKKIPDDKPYYVVIPVAGGSKEIDAAVIASVSNAHLAETISPPKINPVSKEIKKSKINGVPVILSMEGDTPARLAEKSNVSLSYFLKCNDISISDQLIPGQYYFTSRKRTKASTAAYHQVKQGEDLWLVSQLYGVQLKKLKKFNRVSDSETITEGATLWLASTRPKESVSAVTAEVIELDEEQTFSWAHSAESKSIKVADTPEFNASGANGEELEKAPLSTTATDETASKPESTTEVVESPSNSHVVKQGETLYGIAKQYNLPVMEVVAYNNLKIEEGISPGQTIKIPDSQVVARQTIETKQPTGYILHEVKSSETLYSVARKYGVTIKELMEWNNKDEFGVSVGEQLRIQQK